MPTLSRTVPLLLRLDATRAAHGASGALELVECGGQPCSNAQAISCQLDVRVSGEPDARSGYILSIAAVDRALRERLPTVLDTLASAPAARDSWAPELLRRLAPVLSQRLGRTLESLHLRVSPYHCVSLEHRMSPEAIVTRRFDFCAAHRLHLPELSDEQNLALFGKCSLPSGHGHNYRLDVSVADGDGSRGGELDRWSEVVRRELVDRYDHRNLNTDCPEFESLNPSVENIARICHERLEPTLRAVGVRLRRVRVWESEKTWCQVP